MSTDDVLQGLRAANVVLCFAALFSLFVRINDTWPHLHVGGRITRAGIMVLLGGATLGSSLKYLHHAPVDFSIPVVTIGALGVLVGTVVSLTRNDP